MSAFIPKLSKANDKNAFLEGINRNVSLGWTQIHIPGGTFEDIAILEEIKSEGQLLERIYFMVSDGEPADRLLARGPILDPDHMLTVRSIKMYADGALGSRGAALLEKYSDYDGRGIFIFQPGDTKPRLKKALETGIQIGTHAIGDHANRVVLDWYEEAFSQAKKNNTVVRSASLENRAFTKYHPPRPTAISRARYYSFYAAISCYWRFTFCN